MDVGALHTESIQRSITRRDGLIERRANAVVTGVLLTARERINFRNREYMIGIWERDFCSIELNILELRPSCGPWTIRPQEVIHTTTGCFYEVCLRR